MQAHDQSNKDRGHEGSIDSAIRELYPALNRDQCREAEVSLRRYFEIALAIAEEQSLTSAPSIPTMKERSNVDLRT